MNTTNTPDTLGDIDMNTTNTPDTANTTNTTNTTETADTVTFSTYTLTETTKRVAYSTRRRHRDTSLANRIAELDPFVSQDSVTGSYYETRDAYGYMTAESRALQIMKWSGQDGMFCGVKIDILTLATHTPTLELDLDIELDTTSMDIQADLDIDDAAYLTKHAPRKHSTACRVLQVAFTSLLGTTIGASLASIMGLLG